MSNGRDKWEGRVEAQLEAIHESQKELKQMFEAYCVAINKKCDTIEERVDRNEKDIARLEVKSGVLGTIAGFLGGLGAGLIGLFNK